MKNILIFETTTVIEALKKLDLCATKVLFIVNDNNKLIGALTDGDVRRFILSGGNLKNTIKNVYNDCPLSLQKDFYTKKDVIDLLTINKIEVIPIVDSNGVIVDYITWDSVIENSPLEKIRNNTLRNVPIVIMAGGKGSRLKPFTDVLPKPLVPIQEKPIMDWIIEEFCNYGASKFYATLNYRGKMIEAYYSSIDKSYKIEFVWEKDFYGTAGSLKLLSDRVTGTFIVSNCDIIVKANYGEVLDFHKKSKAMMTVVSSIQHLQVQYGVIEFKEGGVVSQIKEKPEYTHAINTGVYILEKDCLDLIPDDEFFHMTQLIDALLNKGEKIVTYPVSENEYVDIGQWKEYQSAVDNFKGL